MDRKVAIRKAGMVFLCLVLAWFVAKLAAYLVSPQPRPVPIARGAGKAAVDTKKSASQKAATVDHSPVLRRNLMRVALEPPAGLRGDLAQDFKSEAALQAELSKLPLSKLNWHLLGTVVDTTTARASRAILRIDGKEAAYGPGDEANGWKIGYIDRRTVVLEKSGKKERLLVGGEEIKVAVKNADNVVRGRLNKKEIAAQMKDLPGLMRQAAFRPSQIDGVYGMQVTDIEPGSLFSRLGLRKNDMLIEANGQSITGYGDFSGLRNIVDQSEIRIELMRDGKRTVLEFEING